MKEQDRPSAGTVTAESARESGVSSARLLTGALLPGFSIGLLIFELWLPEPLAALVVRNEISRSSRLVGIGVVITAMAAAVLAALVAGRRRRPRHEGARSWRTLLSVAFVLPLLLAPSVWHADPLLALTAGVGAILMVTWSALPGRKPEEERARGERPAVPRAPPLVIVLLAAAIIGYAAFVGVQTVRQHQLLETRAYDLGIMENVLWHTSEGRLFASSLEGRNHLGVHTSFIFFVLVPLYHLAPRAETLLLAQSLLLALAAWPLFLLARRLIGSNAGALVVSVLYLLHPAIQGANFYDFHELAFAPLLFFAAAYALEADSSLLLWASALLLLLVKEDCAFVVCGLGLVALMERRLRTGALLVGASVIALIVFQGIVIPHFAGGESSFSWYFSEMIPPGEGPIGLLRTVLLNPLYAVHIALSPQKALYLLQTLGPVLFLCFLDLRGAILVAYGTAIGLFASREYLFQIGFQYPLQLVPEAFAGSLIVLREPTRLARKLGITIPRVLLAMTLVTALLAYHEGMLSPVSVFRSGFRSVTLQFDQRDRERFREVEKVARLIPPSASVTASETLVPHVARRDRVQTLRYARESFGGDYDYFFVLWSDLDSRTRGTYGYVLHSPAYRLVYEGEYTLLYSKTSGLTGGVAGWPDVTKPGIPPRSEP